VNLRVCNAVAKAHMRCMPCTQGYKLFNDRALHLPVSTDRAIRTQLQGHGATMKRKSFCNQECVMRDPETNVLLPQHTRKTKNSNDRAMQTPARIDNSIRTRLQGAWGKMECKSWCYQEWLSLHTQAHNYSMIEQSTCLQASTRQS
jgi:hypothetical protein